jgi:hypothetical protein
VKEGSGVAVVKLGRGEASLKVPELLRGVEVEEGMFGEEFCRRRSPIIFDLLMSLRIASVSAGCCCC